MIKNTMLVQQGDTLLAQANMQTIPYVAGGMTLAGMDCQGLVEYLLIQCGIYKSECNLAGSNAHWRSSLSWQGTPEEAVKEFGSVPVGAALFIWEESGEPSKYAGYNMGNANHMGLYLGGSIAIHASSSRGCVAQSSFSGKTIKNGGWNRIGLLKWVDYGVSAVDDNADYDGSTSSMGDVGSGTNSATITPATPVYVRVETANGKGVRIRDKPSRSGIVTNTAPDGTRLEVISSSGNYYKVKFNGKSRYVDMRYVVSDTATGGATYVQVKTGNGMGVRIREQPSPNAVHIYTAPEGDRMRVLGSSGNYYKVMYNGAPRYVDQRYVVAVDTAGGDDNG